MTKLDSFDAVITWIETILLEIVKGIKGTFHYWDRKKDELEELAD